MSVPPLIVAVRMGLGHLRAALPLAQAAGVPLTRGDAPPVASPLEARVWAETTEAYEGLSRRAAAGGAVASQLLESITAITSDVGPDAGTRAHALALRAGLGAGIARVADGRVVVSTFYTHALAADLAGAPAICVITDTDCARAWVAADPLAGRLVYAAPTEEVVARLRQYGVPAARIALTGFPLPPELVAAAPADTAARADRVAAGAPLHLVAAIGGAGAQGEALREHLRAAREELAAGRVTVDVHAGLRLDLAAALTADVEREGLVGVRVLAGRTFEEHAAAFADSLRRADALWTKPSELAFYAALGVPLALSAAVGVQEERNRDWLARRGLTLPVQGALVPWLLAHRAEAAAVGAGGLERMSREGTAAILALVG